jgi:hypothetical protein
MPLYSELENGRFPPTGSFPLFSELPFDIRLIIWELTWPESRAIEVANSKYDEHEAEYTGTTFLRLTAPLSVLLKTDFGKDSTPDGDPLTECPPPVALHVCRESRRHTLIQYRVMQHPDSPMYSFFYSPSRDVFFISRALSTQPQCVQALENLYRDQLDTITTLLVEDGEWTWSSPADYTEKWLGPLPGLETILVTYGGYDAVWVDYLRNDTSSEVHLSIANSLRKGFKEFLDTGRSRARKLEYIDRNGRFY